MSDSYWREKIEKKIPVKNLLSLLKAIPLFLAIIFTPLLASNKSNIELGIVSALVFCMIGDYFIDKNFIEGMLSFGIAHISLIISFLYAINLHLVDLTSSDILILSIITGLVIIYAVVFVRFLQTAKMPEKYFSPIMVYIGLISFMFLSATWLDYIMGIGSLILLPIGAISFVVSDSVIAIREFGDKELTYSVLKVMAPYYFAIFCISLTPMFV